MKAMFVTLVLLALISCGRLNPSKHTVSYSESCIPYFHFDQLEHYQIDTDLYEVSEDSAEGSTPAQLRRMELITDEKSFSLIDTSKLFNLEDIGFKKQNISQDKFLLINSIFCERDHTEIQETSCIPTYRDILLFKMHDSIVGFARICFECDRSEIIGTKANTSQFGQSGDYSKLHRVVSE